MKKILLVIFFAIFLTIIIYKNYYNENNNILIVGNISFYKKEEKYFNLLKDNYKINLFLYDKINFKQLYNNIIYNDYIIVNNKKVFLSQLINKSKYIIIMIDSDDYYMDKLIKLINNISPSNIIIVSEKEYNYSDKKVYILKEDNLKDIINSKKALIL